MLVYPSNLEGSMTLMGEKGTVRLGGMALNHITKWDFDSHVEGDITAGEVGYEPSSVYGHGHTGWYRNVVDELMSSESDRLVTSMPDGTEGQKSMKLILAIYESARTGRPVTL